MHSPRSLHILHPMRHPERRFTCGPKDQRRCLAHFRQLAGCSPAPAQSELATSCTVAVAIQLLLSCGSDTPPYLLQVRLARQLHLLESSGGACSGARGEGSWHPDCAAAAHHRGERHARAGAVSTSHSPLITVSQCACSFWTPSLCSVCNPYRVLCYNDAGRDPSGKCMTRELKVEKAAWQRTRGRSARPPFSKFRRSFDELSSVCVLKRHSTHQSYFNILSQGKRNVFFCGAGASLTALRAWSRWCLPMAAAPWTASPVTRRW